MTESSPDERDLAALLQAVGARPGAPDEATAAVRTAVAAEWRASVVARRRQRQVRRFTGWAAAAGIAVAAFGVWLARPMLEPQPAVVASLARVVGAVEQNRGDGRWTPIASDAALEAGTQLRTAGDGRAALRLASGVELRLDARTQLALDDEQRATLAKGAVYVDAGRPTGGPGPRFDLVTPAGTVSHLGTQYEARLAGHGVLVAVREGRVRLSGDAGDVIGNAGEQLTVAQGQVSRAPLSPTAANWNWVGSVTPPFEIEGRSVESFLVWAARETGRTVVYESPDAARQARSVILRGTVTGLTPDEAVQAVLSTTSLQPRIQADHIRVGTLSR
jgi:hypothetical protein